MINATITLNSKKYLPLVPVAIKVFACT